MNRIKTLKQLDAILGLLLVTLLPRPGRQMPGAVKKILVIRPGGIGDAVLLIPGLQAIKNKFPDAVIDVLVEKRNAAIFGLCEVVDRVLLYDQGGLMTALRSRYDAVIDTEQWHRLTAVVARLIRSRVKVGYGTNERKKLYTHAVDYSHEHYEVESFFDLLQPMEIDSPGTLLTPFLKIAGQEKTTADGLLDSFAESPFVALFPGASIPERRWGTDKFHQLAVKLSGEGLPVVVIGGREDAEVGKAIVSGADGLNLAGQTSLAGSAAVIEKSALLVSGDSGMLHVGVGLGKPTVSLFGSGIAAKWAPQGADHVVLNKHLPCSPCTRFGYTPPCPIDTRCLREIAVEEVLEAVLSLLQ